MSVITEVSSSTRQWTGAETVFSCGFQARDAADVVVTLTTGSGTVTLTRNLHYSSRLVPANARTAAPLEVLPLPAMPPDPGTLTFTRRTPALQRLVLNSGHFDPSVLEMELDAGALIDQELRGALAEIASEAVRVRKGQAAPVLNIAAFALGALLAMGPDGNFMPVRPDAPTGATYAANILDSTAAGRSLLTGTLEEQRRLVQTQLTATEIAGTTQSILRTHLETCGYSEPWDYGGARYKASVTLPVTPGWQRSADGLYWALDPDQVLTPQMFGAKAQTGFNNATAFSNWANFGGSGHLPLGLYETTATLALSKFHTLQSDNAWIVATGTQTLAVLNTFGAAGVEAPVVHHRGMLRVYWATRNWTLDRTAFFIQNAYSSSFELSAYNATCGLWMNGSGADDTTGMGCVHNRITLHEFWQNMIGVRLTSQRVSGWCNANTFIGGKFYGSATAGEIAAGIYAATCAHIHIESTPYANNGNIFLYPSLEWVGPSFMFARLGGFANKLLIRYMEKETATGTWIVDFGTENTIDATGPSKGLYNPYLPGPGQRIDASLATRPNIMGVTNFRNIGGGGSDILWSDSVNPTLRIRNLSGPQLQLEAGPDGNGIVIKNAAGDTLRTLPAFGVDVVNGGANRRGYGIAAPTTGTWAQGDKVDNAQPTVLGTSPNQYTIAGWVCVTSGTPGSWVQRRELTGT